jgi:catechol 2,3-dioxygenase-like lactoylglutathione lyase family enzyme
MISPEEEEISHTLTEVAMEFRFAHNNFNVLDLEKSLAFSTRDYEAAHRLHKEMGCICYENPQMGIYFIEDPDGYWLEIVPERA